MLAQLDELVAGIARDLSLFGLDIVHPANLGWIAQLDPPPGFRHDALVIIVGNSAALWPKLRQSLTSRELPDHPVDQHVERAVTSTLDELDERSHMLWSHHTYDGSYIPMVAIAHAAGLAHRAPCQLSVHETFGPWLALRGVIILDRVGPTVHGLPIPAKDLCTPCDKPCMIALEDAQKAPDDWRAWLAIRDACPYGHAHRYCEAQIRYHYTKDRRWLETP